jgi:hypothetical protein
MMENKGRTRSFSPRRPALSPAIDAGSFAAMAEVSIPVSWGVPEFHEKITSPNSPQVILLNTCGGIITETFGRLHAFISGDVRDIAYYYADPVGVVCHVLAFQGAE